MEGTRLIEKIRLRNILSFGNKGEDIELRPLNVIIGQNASGKSNLVDIFKLLKVLHRENGLIDFISKNGGINEWIWKGKSSNNIAEIEIVLGLIEGRINYEISFTQTAQRLELINESITKDEKLTIKLPEAFVIFDVFSDIDTARKSEIRKPQPPDALNDFLAEDASNLSLVLNDLEHRGNTKDIIVENLRKFNPRIKDYSVRILGGTVQLFIREEGLEKPISAMRLSDGTLRYLCLLAILCHPEPRPVICIEEPETGLHPDILPTIGELLIEASKRTQLIVTTHSDILVSSFSEVPEAVLVCEADEDGTHLNRLDGEKLKGWLKKYQLGDLWIRGEIGGTRW
jgi:predicted ATPase